MKLLYICLLASFISVASAQAQIGQIESLMDQALSDIPELQISEAEQSRSEAIASALEISPYEYQINGGIGTRWVNEPLRNATYTDWTAGVSRTVRWPDKKRLDLSLAGIERDIAAARIQAAEYDARQTFITLWNDWAQAAAMTETSTRLARDADALAVTVEQAAAQGHERAINAARLRAEAQSLSLAAEQDRTAATTARMAIVTRYPNVSFPEQPPASDLTGPGQTDMTVSNSAQAQLLALHSQKAALTLKRALAETRPDPTLQLDLTNEFNGDEVGLMAGFSIPIGGKSRKVEIAKARSEQNIISAQMARYTRDFQSRRNLLLERIKLSNITIEQSENSLAAARQVLDTLNRGHELGDVTLTELFPAQRLVIEAERGLTRERAKLEALQLELWGKFS